jgi:hypothetical protein
LLGGLLLFELGRKVFNPATGAFAALALLAQPFMIETAARENFTDPMLVCLVIGAVLTVVTAAYHPIRSAAPWLVLAGALLGLSQYARWAAAMLYVPMTLLVIVSAPSDRFARAVTFLASCVGAQAPLFFWNWQHVGTLTFTPTYVFLFLTETFPNLAAFSMMPPTGVMELLSLYGREIAVKWLGQVWVHYKYFFNATSPLLLGGAILSFTLPFSGPQRSVRRFAVALYAALVALNSLVYWDDRYLLPVVPFVALLGVELLRRSTASVAGAGLRRATLAAALALLVASPCIDFYYQTWKSRAQFTRMRVANDEWAGFLDAHLGRDDIVMTVEAPQAAWTTRRTAVGLPRDPETALRIRKHYVPFNTLILDPAPPSVDLFGYSPDWFRVANGLMAFPGFTLEKKVTLPSGRVLALLRASAPAE